MCKFFYTDNHFETFFLLAIICLVVAQMSIHSVSCDPVARDGATSDLQVIRCDTLCTHCTRQVHVSVMLVEA